MQIHVGVWVLIVLIFLVDINFQLVAFGGFYAIPILISLWLRNFRLSLALTGLCCLLAFAEVAVIAANGIHVEELQAFTLQHLIANHAVEVSSLVVVCLIGFWRLRDERDLEESRQATATTLSSIAEGVITIDSTGRITYINRQAEEMSGCSRLEALGQPIEAVLRLSDESAMHATIEDMPEHLVGPRLMRAMLTPRHGAAIPIEKVNSPLRDPEGAQRGDVIVFRDITERERREKDMRTLAYRDTLTNLPNRLALHELLGLELAHAR
ncbi:MAG: PAS domain S-box protein, partial [Planctomycetota bacterium]